MHRRLALVLCLAIAPAVAGQETDLRDDATGRARARELMYGVRSAEVQTGILREAAREAAAWGIGQQAAQVHAGAAPAGTWVNVGPAAGVQSSPLPNALASDTGRLRQIVPHPTDPNILYVATAGGGVWKTFEAQNGAGSTPGSGPRWFSITSGVASQSVGAFALDPGSPDTLFLGLGDPFDVQSPGFYTSLDGGATWQDYTQGLTDGSGNPPTSVRDIVVDPSGTSAIVIATDAGVFRALEGGTWVRKDSGSDCWSVAWAGPSRWVVACSGSVWLSTDNGVTFRQTPLPTADVGRITLAAARWDSNNPGAAVWIYALAATANGGEQSDVFLSQNGGANWFSLGMNASSACSPSCPQPLNWTVDQPDLDVMHDQAWYNQAIAVDPRDHDKVFVGGNLSMMRSDDAGQTWRVMTDWMPASPLCSTCHGLPYVHADWHAMAISLSRVPTFYAGTDGGLFQSYDVFTATPSSDNSSGAPHFEAQIGRGLVTHLAYSIATDLHDSSSTVMIGGLQDNGTRLRAAASPTAFNQVVGADGFAVGIGISNSNAAPVSCRGRWGSLLLGTIYGVVYRSIDCGASFAAAMNGICKPQSQILNPTGGCNVDYGSNFFMKLTSDQADPTGLTFVTVINDSACDPARALCTQAFGTNSVYATHDGAGPGAGWVKANGSMGNFPNQLISVSANPKAAGQWAVTDHSYAYFTQDGGAHWTRTASLPGAVSGVAFENAAVPPALWAATKGGKHVYRSPGGASWTDVSGDLPNVPANTVAVDPNDANTVYLGTEIGLYRTTNGGQNWIRYGGSSLPLVSVTEINVALDSKAIRISTFGRGFWELYPSETAPAGVFGNGDFDHNQVIDGFDLVREAAALGTSAATPGYDPIGNLAGATNAIDEADFAALLGRMGGFP